MSRIDEILHQNSEAKDLPKCKFKIGDKVKVKGNDEVGEIKQYNNWLSLIKYYLVEFTDESHWYTEKDLEPYAEPRWTFTDDEKVILRNLSDGYYWIARSRDGCIYVYSTKPFKRDIEWSCNKGCCYELMLYDHLFQSIKWTDEEACEFRKYLEVNNGKF